MGMYFLSLPPEFFEYHQPFPVSHFPVIVDSKAQMLLGKMRKKVLKDGKQKLAWDLGQQSLLGPFLLVVVIQKDKKN